MLKFNQPELHMLMIVLSKYMVTYRYIDVSIVFIAPKFDEDNMKISTPAEEPIKFK